MKKLRLYCQDSEFLAVFGLYEEQIARLGKENEWLRKRNIELECMEGAGHTTSSTGASRAAGSGSGSHPESSTYVWNSHNKQVNAIAAGKPTPSPVNKQKSASALRNGLANDYEHLSENAMDTLIYSNNHQSAAVEYYKKLCDTLRHKLRRSGVERMQLKGELEKSLKQERQAALSARMLEDVSRRLKTSFYESNKLKHTLQALEREHLETQRELGALKTDHSECVLNDVKLREERTRLLSVWSRDAYI